MDEIKPIFRDLAHPDLLRKCLHGKTQNACESLNNVIWSRVPKTTFVRKTTLQLGTYEAISHFNEGCIVKCRVLNKLGITPGSNCIEWCKRTDQNRIQKAEKAVQEI